MPVTLDSSIGGASANTYVLVVDVNDFIESHLIQPSVAAAWNGFTEDQKAAALIRAAQLLDRHVSWIGEVASAGQALSWPRVYALDRYGREVSSTAIPTFLQEFQIETALWLASQSGVVPEGTNNEFDSIKVGQLEINFNQVTGGSTSQYLPQNVIAALSPMGSYMAANVGGAHVVSLLRS